MLVLISVFNRPNFAGFVNFVITEIFEMTPHKILSFILKSFFNDFLLELLIRLVFNERFNWFRCLLSKRKSFISYVIFDKLLAI